MGIPQQHETDHSNPKERFLWAFQGIGFNGQPLAFPKPMLEEWSEHLSRCGFVHDESQQEIHYQPPVRGQDSSLNLAGEWVPITQEIVGQGNRYLSEEQKQMLIEQFREEGLLD